MPSQRGAVCVVTIHGVGFQQAPGQDDLDQPPRPGYADLLHLSLAAALEAEHPAVRLSDDPQRQPYQRGATVPVYVESVWPPVRGGDVPSQEAGLARLGTWQRGADGRDRIAPGAPPLFLDGAEAAHVALVYTGLEESGADLGALLLTAALGALSLGRFTSLPAFVATLLRDVVAPWVRPRGAPRGSLRVRDDLVRPVAAAVRQMSRRANTSVLYQIADDAGAFVVRNERRELVRAFVQEALRRILARDDVSAVVVNAHSLGTVIAYDALRTLSGVPRGRVSAFVTAGSPLRKFATALSWGREIGRIDDIPTWTNFHGRGDFVADRLTQPPRGRPARDDPAPPGSLFWWLDPVLGAGRPARVRDREVDNRPHGLGGPFPAHDYWDNREQFVREVASIVARAATG